jgi:hypothetical protein
MKDRRRGIDPGEFLVRMGRVRTLGVIIVAALAVLGLFSLAG